MMSECCPQSQWAGVQVSRCPGVQVAVQVSGCPGVQVSRCLNVQVSRCPVSPGSPGESRCPGVQVCKCPGVQVSRCLGCAGCACCAGCLGVQGSRCAGVQILLSRPRGQPISSFLEANFSRPRGHSFFCPIPDAILFVSSRRQIESAVLHVAPFTKGSQFFLQFVDFF